MKNFEEVFRRFTLPASPSDHAEIRSLLAAELAEQRRPEDREEIVRALCVLLFSVANVEDSLLIWTVRQSRFFDDESDLDIQLLCGAGLSPTKAFLRTSSLPEAAKALQEIEAREKAGDFADFSHAAWIAKYRLYYCLTPEALEEKHRSTGRRMMIGGIIGTTIPMIVSLVIFQGELLLAWLFVFAPYALMLLAVRISRRPVYTKVISAFCWAVLGIGIVNFPILLLSLFFLAFYASFLQLLLAVLALVLATISRLVTGGTRVARLHVL